MGNRYGDSLNPRLWVICGKCGSGDVSVGIEPEMDEDDDGNMIDGIVFSCDNCSTIFTPEDMPYEK